MKVPISRSSKAPIPPLEVFPEMDRYELFYGELPFMGSVTMEALVEKNDKALNAVLLAPTGQTMGKLSYDGKNASLESSFIPYGKYVAPFITMDMALCYGSIDKLREFLYPYGIEIEEEDGIRVIRSKGRTLYTITEEDGAIMVENLERGYSYTVEGL